jgi:hypothetical protein
MKWYTRSWERPWKRSASEELPSSVSNRYFLSIRTHGSSCRRRASSSLHRVSSFSASSSASLSAGHSWCRRSSPRRAVPVLCFVIALTLFECPSGSVPFRPAFGRRPPPALITCWQACHRAITWPPGVRPGTTRRISSQAISLLGRSDVRGRSSTCHEPFVAQSSNANACGCSLPAPLSTHSAARPWRTPPCRQP